jgi:hypothetical protein
MDRHKSKLLKNSVQLDACGLSIKHSMPADEQTGGTRSDRMPITILDQHPAQKPDFERHAMAVFQVIG